MLSKGLVFQTIRRIELEARLAMLERERSSLSRRLRSPFLSNDRRCKAIERIGQAQIEWSATKREWEATQTKAVYLSLNDSLTRASVHHTFL